MPTELMEYYLGEMKPIPTCERPLPNRTAGEIMNRESTISTQEDD